VKRTTARALHWLLTGFDRAMHGLDRGMDAAWEWIENNRK